MTLRESVIARAGLRTAPLLLVLLSTGGLTACGGGVSGTTTQTQTSPATAPTATTPTATIPTVPSTQTTTTPTTTTTSPEQQPGGAGDEEPTRVPAQFRYHNGRLTPSEIMVPATFPIEVDFVSDTGPHVVGVGPRRFRIRGPTGGFLLPGLAKGRSLTITVDGKPAGRIVSGLQPGP